MNTFYFACAIPMTVLFAMLFLLEWQKAKTLNIAKAVLAKAKPNHPDFERYFINASCIYCGVEIYPLSCQLVAPILYYLNFLLGIFGLILLSKGLFVLGGTAVCESLIIFFSGTVSFFRCILPADKLLLKLNGYYLDALDCKPSILDANIASQEFTDFQERAENLVSKHICQDIN